MTVSRALFGAASCKDGHVRAFGGLSALGLQSSVESYDVAKNEWTKGASASTRRYAHGTAQVGNGDVLLISGTSDGKNPIASVEIYTPGTDTWQKAADLPTPRLGVAAAASADGRVFHPGPDRESAVARRVDPRVRRGDQQVDEVAHQ